MEMLRQRPEVPRVVQDLEGIERVILLPGEDEVCV